MFVFLMLMRLYLCLCASEEQHQTKKWVRSSYVSVYAYVAGVLTCLCFCASENQTTSVVLKISKLL